MLRKDVKLGLVVAGIMLAVLVVYLLLIPGRDSLDQGAVSLDTGDQSSQTLPDGKTSAARLLADNPIPAAPPTIASPPTTKPSDPFGGSLTEKSGTGDKTGTQDPWIALDKGTIPLMNLTQSAANHDSTSSTPLTEKPSLESAPIISAAPIKIASPVTPATQPTDIGARPIEASTAGMNTHVIRPGESIAKIAEVAYGSQQYFPYIIRANPGLDEKHLKPGTTINMPALADVKGNGASVAGAAPSATRIDLKSQYEVQPGDSLHKIALKLYGSEKKWETIYDLNKEMIGADPAKLKVKTVLKLPEAPSAKQ